MRSFKKYLSDLFFILFLNIFQKKLIRKKIYFYHHSKILILQFGNIQQALTITPLLKTLKSNFNTSIVVATNKVSLKAYANNPFVENTVVICKGYKFITKTLIELNRSRFDVIIDVHEIRNKKASYILGLLGKKYRVGFIKSNEKLLTHKMPLLNSNKIHVVDRLLSLTDSFDVNINKAELNLFYQTSKTSQKIIEEYSINHDLSYKLTALLNISSNSKIGFWGIDNYVKLIKHLRNYDINIIVSATIVDIERAEKIAGSKNIIFYDTEFDLYAELVKNVDFIFSPDSFTIQLAGVFKIPVFCLFVQHKSLEMINVPYNSDFDFALTEKSELSNISFGKVLNSFVPYFEYVYNRYGKKGNTEV